MARFSQRIDEADAMSTIDVTALAQILTQAAVASPAVVQAPANTAPSAPAVQQAVAQIAEAIAPVIAPSVPRRAFMGLAFEIANEIVATPEVIKSDVGESVSPDVVNSIAQEVVDVIPDNVINSINTSLANAAAEQVVTTPVSDNIQDRGIKGFDTGYGTITGVLNQVIDEVIKDPVVSGSGAGEKPDAGEVKSVVEDVIDGLDPGKYDSISKYIEEITDAIVNDPVVIAADVDETIPQDVLDAIAKDVANAAAEQVVVLPPDERQEAIQQYRDFFGITPTPTPPPTPPPTPTPPPGGPTPPPGGPTPPPTPTTGGTTVDLDEFGLDKNDPDYMERLRARLGNAVIKSNQPPSDNINDRGNEGFGTGYGTITGGTTGGTTDNVNMDVLRQQWQAFMNNLPPEDRISFEDWLAGKGIKLPTGPTPPPGGPTPPPGGPTPPPGGPTPPPGGPTPPPGGPTPPPGGPTPPPGGPTPPPGGPTGGPTGATTSATTSATTGATTSTTTSATTTGTDYANRQSIITVLQDRFAKYGLTSLAQKIIDLAQNGATEATITIQLQETPEYQMRFAANADRLKKNLAVLSPAEYINLEDSYRQILRAYGLTQFDSDAYVKQFISNDVSAAELSTRVATAVQRVQNADPALINTLRDYYGISNNDMVGYILDPNQQLQKIQRQVAAAEIGTVARRQGIEPGVAAAEQLAVQGITMAEAQKGYATIADILPTSEKLSQIYSSTAQGYGLAEAEQEIFNSLAEAQKKRERLTALERGSFSGQSGMSRTSLTKQTQGQF